MCYFHNQNEQCFDESGVFQLVNVVRPKAMAKLLQSITINNGNYFILTRNLFGDGTEKNVLTSLIFKKLCTQKTQQRTTGS